jgi:hypothetical protein
MPRRTKEARIMNKTQATSIIFLDFFSLISPGLLKSYQEQKRILL